MISLPQWESPVGGLRGGLSAGQAAAACRPRVRRRPRSPMTWPQADFTRTWLCARLYIRSDLHDLLLAERFPALLETLPAGVDRWCFSRDGHPQPHLTLFFRGESRVLRTRMLFTLRHWTGKLVQDGLGAHMSVDIGDPAIVDVDDPCLATNAVEVSQADSDAVLTQLRLARVGAIEIAPQVLAAAGMANVARAFCGQADWVDRVLGLLLKASTDIGRGAATNADIVPLVNGGEAPAELALLVPCWTPRGEALTDYGRAVRRQANDNGTLELVDLVLASLLRKHHNRAMGVGATRPVDAFQILYRSLTFATDH
jgi:lantibiotic biosynthesis protein